MKAETITLPEMWITGVGARTKNEPTAHLASGISSRITEIIRPIAQSYSKHETFRTIPNHANPGTTYAVYAEYETDTAGPYTFLLGEQVASPPDDSPLKTLHIPAATYGRFTLKGAVPDIVRKAWSKIWQMSPQEPGGTRSFIADFSIIRQRMGIRHHKCHCRYICQHKNLILAHASTCQHCITGDRDLTTAHADADGAAKTTAGISVLRHCVSLLHASVA